MELADSIATATRSALSDLFRERRETFYYVSLITTSEALPPFLIAWSKEALAAKMVEASSCNEKLLKWSYADSPYMACGEHHFGEVNRLFALRPPMSDDMTSAQWAAEYAVRLDAMELAMKQLDDEGAFGRGADRAALVINVEVMPPDSTNTARAKRLNAAGSPGLTSWLEEIAED